MNLNIKNRLETNALSAVGFVLLLILLLGIIFAWPIFIIWSLNTLFPVLAIDTNIWTYLAVCVLNITMFAPKK